MTYIPGTPDYVLVGVILLSFLLDVALVRTLQRNAKRMAYAGLMSYSWAVTAAIISLWIGLHRPWSALLLGPVVPWRLLLGCVVCAIYVCLALRQQRLLLRPEKRERLRVLVGDLDKLMPSDAMDMRWWRALSITAGITEEVIFRGFVLSLAALFMPLAVAIPVSALVFGCAHAYQGPKGILTTGIAGLVLALVAVGTGSLLPAIIMHIVQDLVGGELGYYAGSPIEAGVTPSTCAASES